MKTIGITGRMGSGKTFLAERLNKDFNIPVFDCDRSAKECYTDDTVRDIFSHYYPQFYYHNDGSVNTTECAKVIFGNESDRAFITKLIKPLVRSRFHKWKENLKRYNISLCAIESAQLLESNELAAECDKVFVVCTGNDEINIERCLERNPNWNKLHILSRLELQMSEAEMLSRPNTRKMNSGYANYQIYDLLHVIRNSL